jgi:haloacetate dehalogenase
MAKVMIEVMSALGHARFMACGHDRGARVTYRMALDHPGRLERLALLDIVPTLVMWERIRAAPSPKTDHWIFLSGPDGVPEAEIGRNPTAYLEEPTVALDQERHARRLRQPGAAALPRLLQRSLAHPRLLRGLPCRRHGGSRRRHAGQGGGSHHRRARPHRLGQRRDTLPQGRARLRPGRSLAPKATGEAVDSGHFVPEENPSGCLKALLPFLKETVL